MIVWSRFEKKKMSHWIDFETSIQINRRDRNTLLDFPFFIFLYFYSPPSTPAKSQECLLLLRDSNCEIGVKSKRQERVLLSHKLLSHHVFFFFFFFFFFPLFSSFPTS